MVKFLGGRQVFNEHVLKFRIIFGLSLTNEAEKSLNFFVRFSSFQASKQPTNSVFIFSFIEIFLICSKILEFCSFCDKLVVCENLIRVYLINNLTFCNPSLK